MRSILVAAALILMSLQATAASQPAIQPGTQPDDSFQPAYTVDHAINDDSVADEDYQFRHLLDAQTTRKDLALAKAKSGILKGELERARVLVSGPSFSKEALAYKTWEYRESVSEIARLEGLAKFHIALAKVYKLRIEKSGKLTTADLKVETGLRIEGYEAKMAGVISSLETVRYLKMVTETKELSGRSLLRNGSITPADAEKRAYYAAGAREQEEVLVAQLETLKQMIAKLKKSYEIL